MNLIKNNKIGTIVITLVFLVSILGMPTFSAITNQQRSNLQDLLYDEEEPIYNPMDYIPYDSYYAPEEVTVSTEMHNDAGYNSDTGDEYTRALPIYVGEIVDTAPGRMRTGYLNPVGGDDLDDYYKFSVCVGQTILASLTTSEDFDFELNDHEGVPVSNGYTAVETGFHFLHVFADVNASAGNYSFTVDLIGQNDANTGDDAGDTFNTATYIMPDIYDGYLDMDDTEDWYSFDVTSGEGIMVKVKSLEKSDYDIHLYNPSGDLVHSEKYYGTDELTYPADVTGEWKIKLDIFPGWNESLWPEDYYLYGSGTYILEVELGGDYEALTIPDSQPDIQPVAQTFIVQNDATSNQDEYAYMAAIPAANYLDSDKRYVSPIVYLGDDTPTNWFGTIDDTTQYLIDDWNTYLSRHGMTATEYNLAEDPVQAAGELATDQWSTSDTAVICVDGSVYEDTIRTFLNRNKKLDAKIEITSIPPDSAEIKEMGGLNVVQTFIGPKWGALAVHGLGDSFAGDIGMVTPRFEGLMDDWWPYPEDQDGPDIDVYYPIALPGIWMPYTSSLTGLEELQIIKIAGNRFRIPVFDTSSSLKVTVTTDDPTQLHIYLIDPYGNVRRPSVPHWNGGEVNPIHIWNGGHWEGIGFDDWRSWQTEPSTEHIEEVHYPMKGIWRVIVAPASVESADAIYDYHITVELRKHNIKRTSAALSAANAAVIASKLHAPLLYVTEDSVPSETSNALTDLGVDDIIFVNIGSLSSASPSGTVTELTTLQEVIDYIGPNDDNFITITSLASGDGYYAPAAMIAAYHSSPVLNIGEAGKAYNILDAITAWREYAGDFYHGCRSVGHLPLMDHAFNLQEFLQQIQNDEFPAPGFDLKLRWFSEVNNGIVNLISGYGLEREGQEAYMFVAPRDTDIRSPICRAMTGNNSYAGHIPVETTAFSSDVICRDILYPAIIYANPGRDVTTSQIMNYPDGGTYRLNNKQTEYNYGTRELKRIYSSWGRFYEGHSIWDGYLNRLNTGASISYYAGHGTGGSGISAQYRNVAEQFPQAELTYEYLHDFEWWDGWRGYSGYDDPVTDCPRTGGSSGYNAKEPGLYDIIHFKWVDELFGNLHSELDFWSSCTTGEHFGPMIYLEHGSALWYGNCGSGYGIQTILHDNWMFNDVLVNGESFGKAHSKYLWKFDRDYTTGDPTTLYGESSLFQGYLSNVHAIYGDPTMTIYNPYWNEPTPISV